ncbi:MAG TPA: ATP-binding protein [Nitrospiraceae bacterium]|jgi:SpoVK/Ycf46/Vps4 family AAA+-type ATPase|nr:ATP-binding protein [Nitrospiraceae bacterium]
MARSDLLINLVKASVGGDAHTLRRTVNAIVAEERAKQHNVLADRLERMVQAMPANGVANGISTSNESALRVRDFIAEVTPRRRLDDLVLPESTRLGADQLIEEQRRASLLRSHSLEPRHRLLLVGPPGNGKTTLAEAIAESLAVPYFVVRYESMIGSFLGETASRMKRVFDYARTTPCVLFFDEFDALGKERGDTHETGEIKRVVTSLLMQIDDLPSYTVIIAATNHSELLDRAAWRRFQLRLTLPAPTQKDLAAFLNILLKRADVNLGTSVDQAVKKLGEVSYSEAEEFFLDVMRRQILALGERSAEEIAGEQLKLWTARAQNSVAYKGRNHARTSSS